MGTNQSKKEKNDYRSKRDFFSYLTTFDWIIFIIFIVLILSNIVIYIFIPDQMNPLSTLLFQLIHLIFAIYIAIRVAVISITGKTAEVQKSIARTAIRQIIGSRSVINNLIRITTGKRDNSEDDKMRDALNDLINHLENLSIGIASSEYAFKDILGEELKVEYQGWQKIRESEEVLNKRIIELEDLNKKGQAKAKKRIGELQDEINEIRDEIINAKSSLPITGAVRFPATAFQGSIYDAWGNIAIGKQDFGKDYLSLAKQWRDITPLKDENISEEENKEDKEKKKGKKQKNKKS